MTVMFYTTHAQSWEDLVEGISYISKARLRQLFFIGKPVY